MADNAQRSTCYCSGRIGCCPADALPFGRANLRAGFDKRIAAARRDSGSGDLSGTQNSPRDAGPGVSRQDSLGRRDRGASRRHVSQRHHRLGSRRQARSRSPPGDARGFVGVAFRVSSDASKYECFYLRPTNGRADDQLRRNHSAQYISFPDYEWNRLRTEAPGQYESYVDLVPGEWTKIKVEVRGVKARLYVNGAPQPVLVVNDLKLGDSKGALALWIGVGTEAYFANMRLSE